MTVINDIDSLSDADLVHAVSAVLAVDRTEENSFVLHAPLELLARADLLQHVSVDHRDRARARLASLAAIHAGSGDPIAPPAPDAAGFEALVEAIIAGETGRADALATALVASEPVDDLCRRLSPATLRTATAAAHAPILFGNWPRTAATYDLDPRFTRGTFRRLCQPAGLRFDLPQPNAERPPGSPAELDAALRAVPVLGSPGWGIFLLVHQAETSGVMATLPAIPPGNVDEGFRVAFRVAATSMVLGDPHAAPYEWTHCLSLPVGLWLSGRRHADPVESLDLALTHVAGFRAAYGDGDLAVYDPEPTGLDLAAALDLDPPVAAATAFHSSDHGSAFGTLIDAAAVEHDAHLVKYVHALRDAIAADPSHAPLYRAAGAQLVAWWRHHPPADDPLG